MPAGGRSLGCEKRSRKHTIHWIDGLIDTENADAEVMIVASGTAVSQGRSHPPLRMKASVAGLVKGQISQAMAWRGDS